MLPVRQRRGRAGGVNQAGPERVDEIVEAVYAVLQQVGVRYAEPPANWAASDEADALFGES
jgi:hypothetical protein